MWVQKNFVSKYFLSPKIWIPKQVGSKKFKKKYCAQKLSLSLKKFWVTKARFKKIKVPKNLVQKDWSRSVRTEIFLIWTNVA